jgi:hypothetical protein
VVHRRCSTYDTIELPNIHTYDHANGGKPDDETVPSVSKNTAEADEGFVYEVLPLSPVSSNVV